MKGCILIPEIYSNSYASVGTYLPLFDLIENNLEFDRIICNDIEPKKLHKYDVVMTFKSPQKNATWLMKSLHKLPRDIKLIGYFVDLHDKVDRTSTRLFRRSEILMERCDKIIYAYDEAFKNRWSQFVEKSEWFPQFVPYSGYAKSLPFNQTPIDRCLVSGAISGFYPLRRYVNNNYKNLINLLKHPGYEKNIDEATQHGFRTKYSFLNALHQHICCLSSCSITKYTLKKHFEIPAVGSLLLSDSCEDMENLGFKPSVNYVEVNITNFRDIMTTIMSYPNSFDQIRMNGRKFVLDNHTEFHRFEQFKRILSEL